MVFADRRSEKLGILYIYLRSSTQWIILDPMKIALISAEWHAELVQMAVNACAEALGVAGYTD